MHSHVTDSYITLMELVYQNVKQLDTWTLNDLTKRPVDGSKWRSAGIHVKFRPIETVAKQFGFTVLECLDHNKRPKHYRFTPEFRAMLAAKFGD